MSEKRTCPECEWLWANCKIVYWPRGGGYPIEHDAAAKKDTRVWIEAEMQSDLIRKEDKAQ